MELRNLNTFVRAADAGSFSRAASELGYTQSTVTAQIQGLEEELGVQLFDRLPKGIALTQPGEALLEHARSLLLEAENARLAVKNQREPSGKLRIGAFSSLCTAFLPDLLKQYHQLYPCLLYTSHPGVCGPHGRQTRQGAGGPLGSDERAGA